MVNRGYSSQSAMKKAAERLEEAGWRDKAISILYIGDLDPSGEDMVRDVRDRLELLTRGVDLEVVKLAITKEQVAQFNPPPNPAKMSDSRAAGFVAKFGQFSYEVDALPPDALGEMIQGAIINRIDFDAWHEVEEAEDQHKRLLQQAADELVNRRKSLSGAIHPRRRAVEFLTSILAGGEVSAKQIFIAAENRGISWATLNRAKRDLGVKAAQRRDKTGKKGSPGWTWQLPQDYER